MRRLSDAQQRLQVEVKLAVLQVMRELNKRSKALVGDVQVSAAPPRPASPRVPSPVTPAVTPVSPQRAAEGRQERLQRQQRALSRAQRQQEHVLRFGARALDGPHGAALLLSRRLVSGYTPASAHFPTFFSLSAHFSPFFPVSPHFSHFSPFSPFFHPHGTVLLLS